MNSNDLAVNIQSLSNTELISLLDQPENYLPTAVELAQQEFLRRSLTEEQIQQARSYRLEKENKRKEQREKITKSIQPVQNKFQQLISTFDPLTTDILPTDRAIRVIVIVFGFIALYILFSEHRIAWDSLLYLVQYPFTSLTFLLTYCALPISIFLFYRRKKMGWILLAIYLTYSSTFQVLEIIEVSSLKNESLRFIPQPSILSLATTLLFYGLTIWALCKKSLREVFKVNNETALKCILFTVVLLPLVLYIAKNW